MNRILALYIFLLLCGTVSAQQIVEWSDLQTITDNSRRTVYYKKGRKQPLRGKYRIIRGLDEEHVKLSDGMINGDYRRYRCLLYTSPSPRDRTRSRMPSSA